MSAPTALIINIDSTQEERLMEIIDSWLFLNCKTNHFPASLKNVSTEPELIDIPDMQTYYGVYKVFSEVGFRDLLDSLPDFDGVLQVFMNDYNQHGFIEIYRKNTY